MTAMTDMEPRLCIGLLGADWWGSDPRAMAVEFRRRGHMVLERNYEDYFPNRWRDPVLKAARRILKPAIARDYNRAVEELLDVRALDLLLVFKGMLLSAQTLRRFRNQGTPCYLFYPDVSFFDHGGNIPACLPLYDCVFTSKTYHLEDEKLKALASRWVYAPHGFDPEVHRPIPTGINDLRDAYGSDVSFVGVWSLDKERVINELLDRQQGFTLRIWGPGWERARGRARVCWAGRGAWGDESAAIYSLSRINLGLLTSPGATDPSGDRTTVRSWQIPAAGGFLLHEDTAEIRAAYRAGEEIALFDSGQSLAAQVNHYLKNEDERRAVAAAGHRRALETPYTYARAVQIILEHHLKAETAG